MVASDTNTRKALNQCSWITYVKVPKPIWFISCPGCGLLVMGWSVFNMVGKIPHEVSDEVCGFGCHLVKRVELRLIDQPCVESDVELRFYFTSRPFGDRKKAPKLNSAAAFESFRDIGHYRDSGTAYLIAKSEISSERALLRRVIDRVG